MGRKRFTAGKQATDDGFRNELKTARKISHKNVCRMYHLSKDEEGTQYITMEYVPGEDLKSTVIRIGQLRIGKAISIANLMAIWPMLKRNTRNSLSQMSRGLTIVGLDCWVICMSCREDSMNMHYLSIL